MSLPIRIRAEAEQDLQTAAAWYEEQMHGLGNEFLDEIFRALQRLAEQPELYPPLHRDTRRVLAHRFPFGVFYRIETDCIVVVAVLHGSRDPQAWKLRP